MIGSLLIASPCSPAVNCQTDLLSSDGDLETPKLGCSIFFIPTLCFLKHDHEIKHCCRKGGKGAYNLETVKFKPPPSRVLSPGPALKLLPWGKMKLID